MGHLPVITRFWHGIILLSILRTAAVGFVLCLLLAVVVLDWNSLYIYTVTCNKSAPFLFWQ